MNIFFSLTSIALVLTLPVAPVLAENSDLDTGRSQNMSPKKGQGFIERMVLIDTNQDGFIGDDEAAAKVEVVFLTMDVNDDGELTNDEYMNVRMGLDTGYGRNMKRQKAMQALKKKRFEEMDTDNNGKVSQAEFFASAKAMFLASDTDKDGKVTPWEFRAQRWQ